MSDPLFTLSDMARFHPWRLLRDRHPDIDVLCTRELAADLLGEWRSTGGLELCSTLTQAERRCTLTHELVHVEGGPVPDDEHLAQREEAIVDRIAARRLIELDQLVDALSWNRWRVDADTAGELWVDLPTLVTRVKNLTDDERRYIHSELERRQP